jgi:hypothetical protein
MRKIIAISLLFLAFCSCSNNSSNGTSTGNDSIQNKIKPVSVQSKKLVDFKKLYGRWEYISSHFRDTTRIATGKLKWYKNNGDSNINSFLNDTALFDPTVANFIEFDSAHKWHEFAGEGRDDGAYRIDSLKKMLIQSGQMSPMHCCDPVYNLKFRVIYLDDKYMLLEDELAPNEVRGRMVIGFLKKVNRS